MQYNSPVILTFFLLSLGVLFLGQYTGGWTTTHLFSVYRSSLKDPLFYIRLFGHVLGHVFLHSGLSVVAVGRFRKTLPYQCLVHSSPFPSSRRLNSDVS